jgi:cysteine-S-conjugate beta-lyase
MPTKHLPHISPSCFDHEQAGTPVWTRHAESFKDVDHHNIRNCSMAGDKSTSTLGINTRLAHAGLDPFANHGFVNPPVVRGSTVLFPDAASMAANSQKYTYGTHGTPTTDALCAAIDALEGSALTIPVSSGLVATTLPLLAFLKQGDHLLMTDSVYNPTRRFADKMLRGYGVEVEYYDPGAGAGIEALFRPNTRVVFTESPGSNTFEVQDIPAIVAAAKPRGITVMMDNTWATPLFFKPLDHGVDIVIHAATKYPSGHSDVLMGFVSANESHAKQLNDANTWLGFCIGSDDAALVLRGLRTMGLRLERHQKSAMELALWLETDNRVARVLHPALPSFPSHDLWKRDFCGSSGVFSIVLNGGGRKEAHAFLDALNLFGLGYSWGGFASLAVEVWLADRKIAKAPSEGPVIRLQIGLEDVVDLRADIERGLTAALG